MNKETYIKYRMTNNFTVICWEYYLEMKGSIELQFNQFRELFSIWRNHTGYDYQEVVGYYNTKFGVVEVSKNGSLIKIM